MWRAQIIRTVRTNNLLILVCCHYTRHSSAVLQTTIHQRGDKKTGWPVRHSNPGKGKSFSVLQILQISSGAYPATYKMGTMDISCGVRGPERKAGQSAPSSAEVKNEWSLSAFTPCTGTYLPITLDHSFAKKKKACSCNSHCHVLYIMPLVFCQPEDGFLCASRNMSH